MVDYSSQGMGTINDHNQMIARRGKHTLTIDPMSFEKFLKQTESLDFDIMLEIKDKECSESVGDYEKIVIHLELESGV